MSFLKLVSNHTFPKAYEQVPLSFIHLTKLKSSYIDHLKYEPDLSTHARDKGVKIAVDLRTPCKTAWGGESQYWQVWFCVYTVIMLDKWETTPFKYAIPFRLILELIRFSGKSDR